MNPKNINNLDPKLKETYERVMGTSFPTPQPVSQQTPQNTAPAPEPVQTVQTPTPQPVLQPISAPADPMQASQIFRAGDPFKQPETPPADLIAKANMGNGVVNQQPQKKKHNLMPVYLLIGGVIFFAAYAAIWGKVFGLY